MGGRPRSASNPIGRIIHDGSSPRDMKRRKSSDKITEDMKEYMAKKAEKKALKNAKKLKSVKLLEYSNTFNDNNLSELFVWKKKIKQHVVAKGVSLDEFSFKAEKRRQLERMAEMEKAKKRRRKECNVKRRWLCLLGKRSRAELEDWDKKEDEFRFEQFKVCSEIRMCEGRMKPVDVLVKNLNSLDGMYMEISESYMVFKGLTIEEMEEIRYDIQMHVELDRASDIHVKYWEALLITCDWELTEARRKEAIDRARVCGEQPPQELLAEERGLHSSIDDDVNKQLQGKSCKELEEYQAHIELEMQSGKAKVVEYWEAVLKRIRVYKAKACLREIHSKILHKHLHHHEQPHEHDMMPESVHGGDVVKSNSLEDIVNVEVFKAGEEDADNGKIGLFSPVLVHCDDYTGVIDPFEDNAILERKRAVVRQKQTRMTQEAMSTKHSLPNLKLEMSTSSMEKGDTVFGPGAEVNVVSHEPCLWHENYRPRKPKYFNLVHTGYVWNKYNQIHYDQDNPPPKFVQGYKFKIFYPDLVDKTKTPGFVLEEDGKSIETCIIRFHGSPPYEDIAFRIVNNEWDTKSSKFTFERNVLHVYFNFKRYRYRR